MAGSDDTQHEKLDKVVALTEANQEEIRSIAHITQEQAKMIDKQAEMIDKMWSQVQPILTQHRKRQVMWNGVAEKLITGVAWGVATGVLFLLWRGIMWVIHNDGGNG